MEQNNGNDALLKSWPAGIYAITLFQENLIAARQFYQDVFGLDVVYEDANSCVFKIGETLINLLDTNSADDLINPARVAKQDAGSRLVFTLQVEDVDATCDSLTKRGVTLLNGPMDRPWGIRTASFMDPGGHIWEIAK